MQFRDFSFSGVLYLFVSLVPLNLLVKISIFSVEIIGNISFFKEIAEQWLSAGSAACADLQMGLCMFNLERTDLRNRRFCHLIS